jgi:hypothetical protein
MRDICGRREKNHDGASVLRQIHFRRVPSGLRTSSVAFLGIAWDLLSLEVTLGHSNPISRVLFCDGLHGNVCHWLLAT